MSNPKISVIIPTYNHARYVGEALLSVLEQTYTNYEVVVVNDASQDDTAQIIQQFNDPRVKYICHDENRGLSASRNTGIRASSGDLIAFLDSDDYYHPEKLLTHIEFREKHPDIDITYNATFELNHSAKTIRDLWRPISSISLFDLVLGFPFPLSDILVRKEHLFREGLYDERYKFYGEDLSMNCRLALAGCQYASVDKALYYRRYHSLRVIKNLADGLEAIISVLSSTFSDPRCPEEVKQLRDLSYANTYLDWSYIAFAQNETRLGQQYLHEAIKLNPTLLAGIPSTLILYIIHNSIQDENLDHPTQLRKIFSQFPEEMSWINKKYDWAVARGFIQRGIRAIIWNRMEDGYQHLSTAIALNAQLDETLLQGLSYQLLNYESEFGLKACQDVCHELFPYIAKIGGQSSVNRLQGCLAINRAFIDFHTRERKQVPGHVIQAIKSNPKYLGNRGMWSILIRSMINSQRTML